MHIELKFPIHFSMIGNMNFFSSWLVSLQFLLGLQSKDDTLPEITEVTIKVRNGDLKADVYRPKGVTKGTIITINGLAPLGNRDPRFILVNKGLVKLGYLVICPYYEEICNFKISIRNIEDIKDSIDSISRNPHYTKTGKVSIFAPSFSGSLSLIAATDGMISGRINGICTIGAYGNVEKVIGNLFENQNLDEYGRMILLLNFLPISIGENKDLFKALRLAILDNYYKYKDNLLAPHYQVMKKKDRELFDQLKNDTNFRMKHWNAILKKGGKNRILLTALSVTSHIEALKIPTLFVHGAKDDVVPATESEMMHEKLSKIGRPSKLCITNLISHGDTGFSPRTLIELPRLIDSFSYFFRNATDIH
jgi:pimeloyl-ACP methyl ester carboxylesterase